MGQLGLSAAGERDRPPGTADNNRFFWTNGDGYGSFGKYRNNQLVLNQAAGAPNVLRSAWAHNNIVLQEHACRGISLSDTGPTIVLRYLLGACRR